MRATVAILVLCSLLLNSTAMAQQRHIVDPAAMRQAIAAQVVTDEQNRTIVLGVLHDPQVRELAGRLGLSVMRAEGALSTLDSAELADLAGQAQMAGADLAGGASTLVISTTTLLLIIIIVILIAR